MGSLFTGEYIFSTIHKQAIVHNFLKMQGRVIFHRNVKHFYGWQLLVSCFKFIFFYSVSSQDSFVNTA